jgi:sterol desaturase/sphingolipid hydroxylase (fatty acid hydroxylase superfamily)
MRLLLNDEDWAKQIDPKVPLSLSKFIALYASHRATAFYLIIALATGISSLFLVQGWLQFLGSLLLVALIYPVVEFCLHRFVLHSRALYRMPWTATLWRRIHYDHHMHPNDLSVLFGAPFTTIPAVLVPTLPIGYLAFGWPGAISAACGGFLALMIYEFFHCSAHLPVKFNSTMMLHMRRHHMLHHFHDETGNFGIVTNIFDRIIGTEYDSARDVAPSVTVKNLGYEGEETIKYPWVQQSITRSIDHV